MLIDFSDVLQTPVKADEMREIQGEKIDTPLMKCYKVILLPKCWFTVGQETSPTMATHGSFIFEWGYKPT